MSESPHSLKPQANDLSKLYGRWKKSPLAITLSTVALVVVVFAMLANYWTEFLWFEQLGYQQALLKQWGIRVVLFVGGGLISGTILFFVMRTAYAKRPIYPPLTRQDQVREQLQQATEPLRKRLFWIVPVIVGVLGGIILASRWQEVILAIHGQSFSESDPLFGLNIAFYVFQLPVISLLVAFLKQFLVLILIATAVIFYLYQGLYFSNTGLVISATARKFLAVEAALLALVQGGSYWLDRYDLLVEQQSRFDGAGYTDVHAQLPALAIMAFAAVVVAGLFLAWAFKGDWRLPAVGVGVMLVSALAVGTAYPYFVQNFQVKPNERSMERPYIQHNIAATRKAYGLDNVKVVPYAAKTDADQGSLRQDADTTASIRLLDPAVVSPTFDQRQANRVYWGFDQVLSVDRYRFDDAVHDTVIGVRELRPDALKLDEDSWINQHIIYTHGYGVAAAYGNKRNPDGEPAFFESGVPSTGKLGDFEERIYFGKHSPYYSIVGAPEGSTPQEFDYQSTADENAKQVNNTYQGNGGPKVGSWFNRALYAAKFRDINILISGYINSESQILYDRDPKERVNKVAPFLSLDMGTYPAVVNGRVVWVVDGYTTTTAYPYSQSIGLRALAADQAEAEDGLPYLANRANYIRNSVKATVDAYDGSVKLYVWDEKDPIIKTWQKAFPELFKSRSEVNAELMSHLRYPEDLFRAQRMIYGSYHVEDPDEFFVGQDFWETPADPTKVAAQDASGRSRQPLQPPYYLSMELPGQDEPRFSLSSSYIPKAGQGVLYGFLVADSETGVKAGEPDANYGQLTLLQLPVGNPVNGPSQVQNIFDTEPAVVRELNLLKQGNSDLVRGNLLTVPVGGGLLYVQPVYVKSSGQGAYPLLQMVLTSFGDKVGFAPTLKESLDQIFGGNSGANIQEVVGTTPDGKPAAKAADKPAPGASQSVAPPAAAATPEQAAKLKELVNQMRQAQDEANAARTKGDWAAYGKAQEKLQKAIQDSWELVKDK